MATSRLATWLNLPGKSPVLPVARIRCEKGRAYGWQRKGSEGSPGPLLRAIRWLGKRCQVGEATLGTLRPPSSERSKTTTLTGPRGSTRAPGYT